MNDLRDETKRDAEERLAPLGRALLVVGILLVVVRALTLTTRIPGMPSFWYANQPTWVAVGFGLTGLGWWILWVAPTHSLQSWRPSIAGCRFDTAVLYVGEGCHLCHDAAEVLRRYQQWIPPIHEVDIHTDPELTARFGTCIPVVVFDGKVRFRGKINEDLLRRLIEGSHPTKSV